MTKDWLLGLALCATVGCNIESATQAERDTPQGRQQGERPAVTFARQGRTFSAMVLTMTPVYSEEPQFLPASKSFELQLIITDDANGRVRGAIASSASPGMPISGVSGVVTKERLQLSASELVLEPGTSVELHTLDLSSASGTGTASGTWSAQAGDVADEVAFTARVAITADTKGRAASFFRPENRSDGRFLPTDTIEVRIGEPVSVTRLQAIHVVAGDTPLEGALEIPSPVAGLANSARFIPRGSLPSGATLSIDPAGLTDASGNPIAWDGAALTIAADSGPLTVNPGFEEGLRGWRAAGEVSVSGAFEGVTPADGRSHAIVKGQSSLSGYLDVPADARELSMSFAVFSEMGEFDVGRSVVVTLASDNGTRTVVIDGARERAHDVRGTFGDYRHRIGPRVARVDLTRYRGQRVALVADVSPSGYLGMNDFALVVDDVRVR